MKLDLRGVPTHVLAEAADRLGRVPGGAPWLASLEYGLPSIAVPLAPLAALPVEGVVALLGAVLAERASLPRPPELVWTGPEPRAAVSRETAAVVAGMFRDAQEEVLVACYALDAGTDPARSIFAPLHAAMVARSVRATIFYDVGRVAHAAGVSLADAARATTFRGLYWPFGPPYPALYYDPRALTAGPPCSQHAKMVVTDRRYVLVGSANLTDRGQTRNIELGVKLEDRDLAERLVQHWLAAAAQGEFAHAGE